jgi:hypothetical protein
MHGKGLIGLTNVLEMLPQQPLPLFYIPSSVVRTFSNTISNTRPHYSTTVNTSAPKTIISDNVFESYMLAQDKIAPYLNKMNLVDPWPQQPNNPNWVEFSKFKEDLDNVVNLLLILVIQICIKNHMMVSLIISLLHVVGVCLI